MRWNPQFKSDPGSSSGSARSLAGGRSGDYRTGVVRLWIP